MDDRRIAEWLSVDAPYEEPASDSAEDVAGEPRAEAREVPPPARPATMQRRRRALVSSRVASRVASGVASDLEGQQARVLELIAAVARRIRRRPLAALAIGAGLGFVIGGALSFRAGRLLLAAGARQAARELLKQLI